MALRVGLAVVICLCASAVAPAQVVRFQTTMGDFDMVLNPTNNTKLQAHVDNMLDYVERGSYNGVWINRSDRLDNGTPFVLQMGGFYSMTARPIGSSINARSVRSFTPVPGEPASENPGLSNTVGTVSLALSGGANGTNQNSGTNSFFVNAGNNSGLDGDFTVFAAISDMSVINQIMALTTLDRTLDPVFGEDPKNLTFTDVPIQADGKQVFIKRAFVISDTIAITQATSSVKSVLAQSQAAFADSAAAMTDSSNLTVPVDVPAAALTSDAGLASGSGLTTNNVPEPASAAMCLIGTFFMLGYRRLRPR
jgi:cyclophilin family peptidyl-prolyl cis-trans isomerase